MTVDEAVQVEFDSLPDLSGQPLGQSVSSGLGPLGAQTDQRVGAQLGYVASYQLPSFRRGLGLTHQLDRQGLCQQRIIQAPQVVDLGDRLPSRMIRVPEFDGVSFRGGQLVPGGDDERPLLGKVTEERLEFRGDRVLLYPVVIVQEQAESGMGLGDRMPQARPPGRG